MQPSRTRIKICGITRPVDLSAAVALGADAVGFVFYPPSKRCLTPDQARTLRALVPAFVSTVALFVDPSREEVDAVVRSARPALLQFHGDESPEQCENFGVPYLKAFRVGAPGLDTPHGLAQTCARYASADGWLFDSYTQAYGGSGTTCEHALLGGLDALDAVSRRPCVLSGGLTPESVEDIVRALRPWAVDVSSGVETSPGVKSLDRMRDFVLAVARADASL